jgi:redox-sensitive bicupin YhaK (pirin superfamily)
MKKKISFSASGQRADIGEITIHRILPNRYAEAVGPFVFLDHMGPLVLSEEMKAGTGAHPHRGIATLTYLMQGQSEHFDSAGNHAMVRSGGIQWMKAGRGIIHDEAANPDVTGDSPYMHGFQFWINLPPKEKAEKPAYMGIQGSDVPKYTLPENGGWLKVIVGTYADLVSKIPTYTHQFLYHIHLEEKKQLSLTFEEKTEVAAFLPTHGLVLNDTVFGAGEFVEFDREGGEILLHNTAEEAVDILLFGGEHYEEPIVAHGPFVMNTPQEIAQAYTDYYAGEYGEVYYPNATGVKK